MQCLVRTLADRPRVTFKIHRLTGDWLLDARPSHQTHWCEGLALFGGGTVVYLGPLSPDFEPGPPLDVCWCRQCSRGPECATMEQRRAEMWLTETDRRWLSSHGWRPS